MDVPPITAQRAIPAGAAYVADCGCHPDPVATAERFPSADPGSVSGLWP